MSAAEIEAAGAVLIGWWILACYLGVCLIVFAEPIQRALCRGWRFVVIAWWLLRDPVLQYDLQRALRAARRHT